MRSRIRRASPTRHGSSTAPAISAPPPARPITIDTSAPAAALAITAIATDSGTAGDFITNDTTLTVSGTNGALGAGEKIQVSSDGGATWTDVVQNGTTWSLADAVTHPASFTYQARIIDSAGNVGTTASQAITIDTSAPAAALAITAIAGSSSPNVTSITVSGSNGALANGDKVQISSDGGATWTDVVQNTATSWSFVDSVPRTADYTYRTQDRQTSPPMLASSPSRSLSASPIMAVRSRLEPHRLSSREQRAARFSCLRVLPAQST